VPSPCAPDCTGRDGVVVERVVEDHPGSNHLKIWHENWRARLSKTARSLVERTMTYGLWQCTPFVPLE
jgi:hypothetical protein